MRFTPQFNNDVFPNDPGTPSGFFVRCDMMKTEKMFQLFLENKGILLGGKGSTRWGTYTKKDTTEGVLDLDLKQITRRDDVQYALKHGSVTRWHKLQWTTLLFNQKTGNVEYSVSGAGGNAVVLLRWSLTNGPDMAQRVYLESTPVHFGGVRWWFVCPQCGNRCRVIYRPSNNSPETFACRPCSNLTYHSAQNAHRFERSKGMKCVEIMFLEAKAARARARLAWNTRGNSKRAERLQNEIAHTQEKLLTMHKLTGFKYQKKERPTVKDSVIEIIKQALHPD